MSLFPWNWLRKESEEDSIIRYCRRHLLGRLGCGETTHLTSFSLNPGTNCKVFGLSVDGFGKVVVRLYPVRRDGRDKAREQAFAQQKLKELGVPVPDLYWQDSSTEAIKGWGGTLTAEEFLEGKTPDRASVVSPSSALHASLAKYLAAIHSNTSDKPWRHYAPANLNGTLLSYYCDRTNQYLEKLVELQYLTSVQRDQWENEFRGLLTAEILAPPHSLIHGDLSTLNMIQSAAGELRLIDLGTVRYDHWLADLVDLKTGLFAQSPEDYESFLDRYFEYRGELLRQTYHAQVRAILAFQMLERAYSHSTKMSKARKKGDATRTDQFNNRCHAYLEKLTAILSEEASSKHVPGSSPVSA